MIFRSIHRWDKDAILKALALGASIEAIAIAPAVFSTWGHAGPESFLGWLSILLNLPGMYLLRLLGVFKSGNASFTLIFASIFLVQTVMISYLVFVYLRWKKL